MGKRLERLRRSIAWAVLLAGGCAAPTTRVAPAEPRGVAGDIAAQDLAEDWARHEDEVLAPLVAADPTLALRFGSAPSLDGPEAEVEADWLAPRLRARGLEGAEAALGRWADSARLPQTATGRAWELRLERQLAIRAVREERFRLDHESELPRAASELVRAIALARAAAPGTDSPRAHERWIARRLEEIGASLRGAGLGLDIGERAELEDALDAVERGASPATTAVLVHVRTELEAAPRAPTRPADAARLEQSLGAHAGTSFPIAVVRSRLERAESAAREAVVSHRPRLTADEVRRAEKDADLVLFGSAPCAEPDNPSRIRRASPSPERAAACAEVRLAKAAASDAEVHTALLALHDHAVVALWALALRATGAPPDLADPAHRLLAAVPPEHRARLARLAAVRPTAAVTAGLAADMLARRGPLGMSTVARAWSSFGDAPLDIVEREVLAKLP